MAGYANFLFLGDADAYRIPGHANGKKVMFYLNMSEDVRCFPTSLFSFVYHGILHASAKHSVSLFVRVSRKRKLVEYSNPTTQKRKTHDFSSKIRKKNEANEKKKNTGKIFCHAPSYSMHKQNWNIIFFTLNKTNTGMLSRQCKELKPKRKS